MRSESEGVEGQPAAAPAAAAREHSRPAERSSALDSGKARAAARRPPARASPAAAGSARQAGGSTCCPPRAPPCTGRSGWPGCRLRAGGRGEVVECLGSAGCARAGTPLAVQGFLSRSPPARPDQHARCPAAPPHERTQVGSGGAHSPPTGACARRPPTPPPSLTPLPPAAPPPAAHRRRASALGHPTRGRLPAHPGQGPVLTADGRVRLVLHRELALALLQGAAQAEAPSVSWFRVEWGLNPIVNSPLPCRGGAQGWEGRRRSVALKGRSRDAQQAAAPSIALALQGARGRRGGRHALRATRRPLLPRAEAARLAAAAGHA